MGNIGSQTGQISQRIIPEEQWANSYPRSQHKVLPDRDSRQKLRPTNNGEILQSGGTLTGRQHQQQHQIRTPIGKHNENGHLQSSPYVSHSTHKLTQRTNHYLQHKQSAASQNALKGQVKLFTSEPDLRYSSDMLSPERDMKERRLRKKYKAPPPPNITQNERITTKWDDNSSNTESPPRRARLFKTRIETKKYSSHVYKTEYIDSDGISASKRINSNLRSNRLSLPELNLIENDDFQKELKEATKRLRNVQTDTIYEHSEKQKLKTLDPSKDNMMKKKFKQIIEVEVNNNIVTNHFTREETSGKEEEKEKKKEQPKTFYFGMEESSLPKLLNSSESDLSSDIDPEDSQISNSGIDLQLRPILPKKQLEIPRFSPATAWKLLATMDPAHVEGTVVSEDLPVFIEERIEKYARPPPPNIQIGQRSNNDKSGDSGISGDAGPAPYDDNPDLNSRNRVHRASYFRKPDGVSWTPQQDLGDDSSLEELNLEMDGQKILRNYTHLNRPHVFSLSLPRDNHLASYMVERRNSQYTGLQKLKRSVSGVLNNFSHKRDYTQTSTNQDDDSNWFFSKSAPNSGFNSLEMKNTIDSEQTAFSSSLSKTTARVMYLPEQKNADKTKLKRKDVNEFNREEKKHKLSTYSKSCDDIITEVKNVPEPLQDPPNDLEYLWKPPKKAKKFTFQSTVRQIERRRMAEKLSREAEKKEQQRLRELEAMQKVEEEFQKKRAREKATIRQQLRLYCMDDNLMWCSLPPNLETKNEERQEPDGAFSSSTTSSSPVASPNRQNISRKLNSRPENKIKAAATRELSEYRQVQRDYKDYRGNIRYASDSKFLKQTTVHPQITCNMPKAKGSAVVNGNYRKEFANGVRSSRSVSTHSEDSQNNSPKMYRNKYAPITRF